MSFDARSPGKVFQSFKDMGHYNKGVVKQEGRILLRIRPFSVELCRYKVGISLMELCAVKSYAGSIGSCSNIAIRIETIGTYNSALNITLDQIDSDSSGCATACREKCAIL